MEMRHGLNPDARTPVLNIVGHAKRDVGSESQCTVPDERPNPPRGGRDRAPILGGPRDAVVAVLGERVLLGTASA